MLILYKKFHIEHVKIHRIDIFRYLFIFKYLPQTIESGTAL
jgi:hypothetical protein